MLSGNQVTQHGISGYSQIRYGLFTGKAEQVGIADIDGRVTLNPVIPVFTLESGVKSKTLKRVTPINTVDYANNA